MWPVCHDSSWPGLRVAGWCDPRLRRGLTAWERAGKAESRAKPHLHEDEVPAAAGDVEPPCTDLVPAWLLPATPVVVGHIFLSLACRVEGHWKEIFGSRGRSDLGLVLSVFCDCCVLLQGRMCCWLISCWRPVVAGSVVEMSGQWWRLPGA